MTQNKSILASVIFMKATGHEKQYLLQLVRYIKRSGLQLYFIGHNIMCIFADHVVSKKNGKI